MKKMFLAASLFAASFAQAQTIDTTSIRPYSVVRISTPFQVCFNDTTKATFLMVESVGDNFKDRVMLTYTLFAAPGAIQNGMVPSTRRIFTGAMEMTGSAYSTWKTKSTMDTDRKYIFQFVADKLNLAIQ